MSDVVIILHAPEVPADLVSARQGDLSKVTVQYVKDRLPIDLSRGLNHLILEAVDEPCAGNDWTGVWFGVLSTWGHILSNSKAFPSSVSFDVLIRGKGRESDRHRIFAIVEKGKGLTFMLVEDC